MRNYNNDCKIKIIKNFYCKKCKLCINDFKIFA